ncbi:MAG: alpha/beta hydrolase [Chitinophagales bacterium]
MISLSDNITYKKLLIKYTNSASRFMVIDGAMIHYRDEGSGYPILLIHGSFSSLHTFNAWANELSLHYRVIRLDLQGFGLSDPREYIENPVEEFKSLLTRFLNILGVYNCHIAGSSLGGWIAWEFALAYPERIKKLVLIDAAGYLDKDNIPLPFKMAQAPFAGSMMRMALRRDLIEYFIKQVYADASKISTQLIDRYYELFMRKGNPEAFISLVNARYKDHSLHLKHLQTPTLILWGEADKWLGIKNAYRFEKDIPFAELITYPNVGHVPMEEIPEKSVHDVIRFLNKK